MSVRDFLFFLILKVGTHWGTCDGEIKRGYVSEATLHVVAKKNWSRTQNVKRNSAEFEFIRYEAATK